MMEIGLRCYNPIWNSPLTSLTETHEQLEGQCKNRQEEIRQGQRVGLPASLFIRRHGRREIYRE